MKRRLALALTGAAAVVTVGLPAHQARPAPVAVVGCVDTSGLEVLGVVPGSYQVCVGPKPPPD